MSTWAAVISSLDLIPIPMMVVSDEGVIEFVNDPMQLLFGYGPGELEEELIEVLLPPDLCEASSANNVAFLAASRDRTTDQARDLTGRTKDGRSFPLELTMKPMRIDGRSFAVISTIAGNKPVRDEPEDRVAVDTAMLMVDSKGRIAQVNEALLSISGYSRDALIGRSIEILISQEKRTRHVAERVAYQKSTTEKEMSPGRRIELLNRDGALVPVQVTLFPVGPGAQNGVMCAIVDLRQQIAKNSTILAQNDALVVQNKELSQFAYSVSHDLKAPMASIQGLLRIAREDIEAGDIGEVVEAIDQTLEICARGREKVERILELSRDRRDDTVGLVHLPQKIHTIWRGLLPGAGVVADLELKLAVKEFNTSETGLEVILQNLVSNALAYHDPAKDKTIVGIETEMAENALLLRVRDNGVGIREEQYEKVFDLFHKLDNRAGDGIGLTLVRRHVARLGGKVDIESEVGRGTTFSVRLPLAA